LAKKIKTKIREKNLKIVKSTLSVLPVIIRIRSEADTQTHRHNGFADAHGREEGSPFAGAQTDNMSDGTDPGNGLA
jgi:hypothetical protein